MELTYIASGRVRGWAGTVHQSHCAPLSIVTAGQNESLTHNGAEKNWEWSDSHLPQKWWCWANIMPLQPRPSGFQAPSCSNTNPETSPVFTHLHVTLVSFQPSAPTDSQGLILHSIYVNTPSPNLESPLRHLMASSLFLHTSCDWVLTAFLGSPSIHEISDRLKFAFEWADIHPHVISTFYSRS